MASSVQPSVKRRRNHFRASSSVVGLLAVGLLAACDAGEGGGDPHVCTDEAVTSVFVTLRDPVGGAVSDETVTFTVDGSAPMACEAGSQGTYFCGEEQLGAFTITVEAAGFVPVQTEIIVDDETECHVLTEELTFHLVAM